MKRPTLPARFGPPAGFSLAAHHAKFNDIVGPPPEPAPVCGPANHRLYKAREAERTKGEQKMNDDERRVWEEYDSAAEWCSKHRLTKDEDCTQLPPLLSARVLDEINADPEAFAERVRLTRYARAMNKLNLPAL